MKVLHVITDLYHGGAEQQLSNLLQVQNSTAAVFSIKTPGTMRKVVERFGTLVYSGDAVGTFSLKWISALHRVIKDYKPDVVMGWMYHGNLAATASRALGHRGPVIWNVRHSVDDLAHEKTTTRWAIRAGAAISRQPVRIVYNSMVAADQHERLGYASSRRVVLPNGFDLERFRPSQGARASFRARFAVAEDDFLIGVIGRSHPMKNHIGWVEAFRQVIDTGFNARCIIMGAGVDANDTLLAEAIRKAGMDQHIIRLPLTLTPEQVYPALDLLVLPSLWGEGFPNVIGEAMACGVPVITTNVGDAAYLVGDTGFISVSGYPVDLANITEYALSQGSNTLLHLGKRARKRMETHFGLTTLATNYYVLFSEAMM